MESDAKKETTRSAKEAVMRGSNTAGEGIEGRGKGVGGRVNPSGKDRGQILASKPPQLEGVVGFYQQTAQGAENQNLASESIGKKTKPFW